jgi:hypothetical protein
MTCPSCGAALPEPPERFCPHCGADLEAAPPADSPLTTPRPRSGTPWEDRGRIGFVPALVETTQKVLTKPSEFFASMPVTGGIGGPLLYGILIGTLGVIVAAVYREVFQALVGSTFAGLGSSAEMRRVMPFLMGGVGLVVQVVFSPIFVILGLFVVAAIVHLFLLLLRRGAAGLRGHLPRGVLQRGRRRHQHHPALRRGDLGRVLPRPGIIGLAAAHGIGKGTAAAAVLLPLVLLCCCCAGAACSPRQPGLVLSHMK